KNGLVKKTQTLNHQEAIQDINIQLEKFQKANPLEAIFQPQFIYHLHQAARAISSLGLQIFNKKIQQFNGLFYVSTPSQMNGILGYIEGGITNEETRKIETIVYNKGTYYNIILPLDTYKH